MNKKKNPFNSVRNPTIDEIKTGTRLLNDFESESENAKTPLSILSNLFETKFEWCDKHTMNKKQKDIFILKTLILIKELEPKKTRPTILNIKGDEKNGGK